MRFFLFASPATFAFVSLLGPMGPQAAPRIVAAVYRRFAMISSAFRNLGFALIAYERLLYPTYPAAIGRQFSNKAEMVE